MPIWLIIAGYLFLKQIQDKLRVDYFSLIISETQSFASLQCNAPLQTTCYEP
jgi:hypothetical protein